MASTSACEALISKIEALAATADSRELDWIATAEAIRAATDFLRVLYADEDPAWSEPLVDATLAQGVDIIWRRGGRGVQVQFGHRPGEPTLLWRLVTGETPEVVGEADLPSVRVLLDWMCERSAG